MQEMPDTPRPETRPAQTPFQFRASLEGWKFRNPRAQRKWHLKSAELAYTRESIDFVRGDNRWDKI